MRLQRLRLLHRQGCISHRLRLRLRLRLLVTE
jgi:hypothetical protein